MPLSPSESLLRRFFEAIDQEDYEAVAALCSEQLVWTSPGEPPMGGTFRGREAFMEAFKAWEEPQRTAFPEGLTTTITNVVDAGERLAVEWVCTGRTADGRDASFRGATFVEISEGKIVSGSDYWDMAEMMPYFQ
jgi:hypothetical protein